MTSQTITLRIIGGEWRSRKISCPDREDLRPTPDRVRETLFNWLQFEVNGARCLELYAGSGVLGMEALSRGAAHVTFVDSDSVSIAAIRENLDKLKAAPDRYTLAETPVEAFLTDTPGLPFDIVFMDPPFRFDDIAGVLTQLVESGMLGDRAQCYVESPKPLPIEAITGDLVLAKQKRAGQVHYCLLERAHR